MMDENSISISIVIPAYNEEEVIEETISKLADIIEQIEYPVEVLIVDDGSTDRTYEILKRLFNKYEWLNIIKLLKNYGQTTAFEVGIKYARYNIIVTMDADLQNDPEDLPYLIRELIDRDVDFIAGYRKIRHDSFIKRISSKIANTVRNIATGDNIIDTGCSLKIFWKYSVSNIKFFKGMHRFLPTLVKMEGYKVEQVPVKHNPRLKGYSKYGVLDRLKATVPDLIAVMWMKSRIVNWKVQEHIHH